MTRGKITFNPDSQQKSVAVDVPDVADWLDRCPRNPETGEVIVDKRVAKIEEVEASGETKGGWGKFFG